MLDSMLCVHAPPWRVRARCYHLFTFFKVIAKLWTLSNECIREVFLFCFKPLVFPFLWQNPTDVLWQDMTQWSHVLLAPALESYGKHCHTLNQRIHVLFHPKQTLPWIRDFYNKHIWTSSSSQTWLLIVASQRMDHVQLITALSLNRNLDQLTPTNNSFLFQKNRLLVDK